MNPDLHHYPMIVLFNFTNNALGGHKFSFDLVIPSVPGFGFSGKTITPRCNSKFVADISHKLMTKLGYKRYAGQGGDIGSGISTWLSLNIQPILLVGTSTIFLVPINLILQMTNGCQMKR